MKKFILSFMFGLQVLATEVAYVSQDVNTPVPKELKDAIIMVKTKDGHEHIMNINDFKVVPRKQQFKIKERVVSLESAEKVSKNEKK